MLITVEKPTVGARQFGVVCRDPVIQIDAVETLREVFPGAAVHMAHGLGSTEAEIEAQGACSVLLVIGPGMHVRSGALASRLVARGASVVLVDCDPAEWEAFGIQPIELELPFTSETLAAALQSI